MKTETPKCKGKMSHIFSVKEIGLLLAVYLLFFVIMFVCKSNYHVDEIYSYGLSNNQTGIAINYEWNQTYEDPEQLYLDYLTVQLGHRFDYANVWKNQSKDVHPPLYYALLHTICSFFPGKFSVWQAAVINIIFGLLIVLMVLKICEEIFEINDKKILFCILIGFIGGAVHIVTFLRMYMMLMFECTLAAYLLLKHIEKQFHRKDYLALVLITLCGALTHYYFIVYIVLSCIIFGIIMLLQKRWKETIIFSVAEVLTGGLSVLIFPSMIKHMFLGYRGIEAIDNLINITAYDFWSRIKYYYGFINNEIFGGWMGCFLIFGLLVVTLSDSNILHQKKALKNGSEKILSWTESHQHIYKYVLLILPLIIFFLFVAKSAGYIEDRYISPIFAIVYVLIWGILWHVLKNIKTEYSRQIATMIIVAVVSTGSFNTANGYLYLDSGNFFNTIKTSYSGLDAVVVWDAKWKTQASFEEIRNYGSVTFIEQKNLEKIKEISCLQDNDEFMVLVPSDSVLNQIKEYFPDFEVSEKIGQCEYTSTYHMSCFDE